jgi:hypothetical protein
MGAIDIGPGAIDLDNQVSSSTIIDKANPANGTGSLDSFEFYAYTQCASVKVGTFYGSDTSWTMRDYESIGTVNSGSKQTFTGKDCTVNTNDLLGVYYSSGYLERSATGGSGFLSKSGDQFGNGTVTYSSSDTQRIGIYATGTTTAGWTTAKLGGITSASIIKVAGIAVASVKKVAGVAVQ